MRRVANSSASSLLMSYFLAIPGWSSAFLTSCMSCRQTTISNSPAASDPGARRWHPKALPTTRELVHERAYRTQVTLIDPGGRVDFVTGP